MGDRYASIVTGNRLMAAVLVVVATLGAATGATHLWRQHRLVVVRGDAQKITQAAAEAVCYPATLAAELNRWRVVRRHERAAARRGTDIQFMPDLECLRFDVDGRHHEFIAQQVYWRPAVVMQQQGLR